MIIARRQFLQGLGSLLAAPAIVRIDSIMPVKLMLPGYDFDSFDAFSLQSEHAYQWVANTTADVFGTDAYGRTVIETIKVGWGEADGWKPVPASVYNDRFDIKGDTIVYGDCTLMQRSRKSVMEARQIEIDTAKDLGRVISGMPSLPKGMHWLELKTSVEIRPLEDDLKKYGR